MGALNMQPCWTCNKYYGDCSWTKKKPEPVPGWDATPTVKFHGSGGGKYCMHSYAIHSCPEYEWDGTVVSNGGQAMLPVRKE